MERYRDFTVLITKINRSIKRIKSEEMSEFNLKGPFVTCLYYLYVTGGTTATEICEMAGEDKATISRSLEYLEENEYITTETSQKKKYNAIITLTQKGEEIGQKISKKIDNILGLAGAKIKDKKRKIMYDCLGTICENLDGVIQNYDGGKTNEYKNTSRFGFGHKQKRRKKTQCNLATN